jgi:hypothetical protein
VLLVAAIPNAHRRNFLRSLLMDVVTFHHLKQLMVVRSHFHAAESVAFWVRIARKPRRRAVSIAGLMYRLVGIRPLMPSA